MVCYGNIISRVLHCSDKLCTSTKSGTKGLVAVSTRIRACKRRYNLQFYDDCIRAEIPTYEGLSLLTGTLLLNTKLPRIIFAFRKQVAYSKLQSYFHW